VEVLLVRPEDGDATGLATGRWLAMLSAGGRPREGETLTLEGTGAKLHLLEKREGGYWLLEPDGADLQEVLAAGEMPLPPYVRRARERRGLPASIPQLDADRYQTVFARRDGAVAAPTAGLHFTPELLARLAETGVEVRTLSLMVGPGTFRPVKAQRLEDHAIESERYHLPGETAAAVRSAIESGRRIVATGTTVCRVLEYVARRGEWTEHSGWTDLFIHPPFEFRAVGALITNFHLPRSTLLMLVCAFAGREAVMRAYRDAVARAYRFYSYGDAMFIG
jgi:S-adenosylmethionine:tRNA ribosyltransferase-isomerase